LILLKKKKKILRNIWCNFFRKIRDLFWLPDMLSEIVVSNSTNF
jgi:hypothetical protein